MFSNTSRQLLSWGGGGGGGRITFGESLDQSEKFLVLACLVLSTHTCSLKKISITVCFKLDSHMCARSSIDSLRRMLAVRTLAPCYASYLLCGTYDAVDPTYLKVRVNKKCSTKDFIF